MPDKYKAIWMSHSSYENYIKCPRLYYLANIYKDPKTKNKISVTSPYIALGVAVHSVLEPLMEIKSEERRNVDLIAKYDEVFNFWRGDMGGWTDTMTEQDFYERGKKMIEQVKNKFESGDDFILSQKSIRPSLYYKGDMIPNIILDERENIILCGSIDWIVYNESSTSSASESSASNIPEITVLDFKTGRNEESAESKQLLLYKILFESLQDKWKVSRYAYYYLDRDEIVYKNWSDSGLNELIKEIKREFIRVGIEIRDKRYECFFSKDNKYIERYVVRDNVEGNFKCPLGAGGCRNCLPYEKVLRREAKYVGLSLYGQDLYRQ